MKFQDILSILSCLAGLSTLQSAGADKFVWTEGHGDVAVNYAGDNWEWTVEQGKPLDEVIIRLGDVAQTEIPADPAFSFLGTEGDVVWILPAAQMPDRPFMGVNAEDTESGIFVNDRLALRLKSINGPGNLVAWTTSGTGSPTILMNSRDGITAADEVDVPVGGHFHANWAFTAPGTYHVTLQASGTLIAGGVTASEPATLVFEVSPPEFVQEGELDLEVALEEVSFELGFHDHERDRELEIDDVVLVIPPAAEQTVPNSPAFSFLGAAGASVYMLTQEPTEGLLFLGIAGEEIETGLFAEDQIELELVGASGPGTFALYAVDGFGNPTVFMNTGDGISSADVFPMRAGSHNHVTWAFGAPGEYQLDIRAVGTLTAGNQQITSDTVTLRFLVQGELAGVVLRASLTESRQLEIAWEGKEGVKYQLQSRSSLAEGGWMNEGAVIPGTAGSQKATQDLGTGELKVFRLLENQP